MNAWLKTKRRNSGRKQQSFVLTAVWRVVSDLRRDQREVVRPSQTCRVELQAAAAASSSSAAADQYQGFAFPGHGVKRMRWSPQVQDTREFDPNESMETARVQPQGLLRQPESTTEELEDGDQGDADANMKMLGAVCEESVITIGLVKLMKSLTLTMSMEVSWIQIWPGKHDWKSQLDSARCRCIVVSQLVSVVLTK